MHMLSRCIPVSVILAGLFVAAGPGCGGESSAFAPNDPSQASRGIAAGPRGEPEVATAALTSAKTSPSCSRSVTVDQSGLDELTAGWPAKPRGTVKELAAKYGMPIEASSESVVWHDAGAFKRIMVTKAEVPHDFPKPHTDFIEHTIALEVPAAKVSELAAFDTSMSVNRTAGELSARGDREAQNLRTLDLAREIIAGKTSVANARKALGAPAPPATPSRTDVR